MIVSVTRRQGNTASRRVAALSAESQTSSPCGAGWRPLRVTLLAFATCAVVVCVAVASQSTRAPVFVFRYDDVAPATGDPKVDAANYRADEGVIDVFRRNGVAVTLAVIPYVGERSVLDDKRLTESLRRAAADGSAEVALHGYRHTDWHLHRVRSEWAGVSYEQQRQWLKEGKDILEKAIPAPVTTFVPPYNTYDRNTLRALATTGFRTLSARLGEPRGKSQLHYVPWLFYRDPEEMANGAFAGPQPNVTLFMMHRADYNGHRLSPYGWRDLDALDGFVRRLKSLGGRIVTVSQAAELLPRETSAEKYRVAVVGSKGARLGARALRTLGLERGRGARLGTQGVYWPQDYYARWRLGIYLPLFVVGLMGIFLCAALIRLRVVRRLAPALAGLGVLAAGTLLWLGLSATSSGGEQLPCRHDCGRCCPAVLPTKGECRKRRGTPNDAR